MLRPKTYPFSPTINKVVVVFLPILLPSLFAYLLVRFVLESYHSQRRITRLRAGALASKEGRLRRVGLVVAQRIEEAAEEAGVIDVGPGGSSYVDSDLEAAKVDDELTRTAAVVENGHEHESTTPPPKDPPLATIDIQDMCLELEKLAQKELESSKHQIKTDPKFSPAQLRMIANFSDGHLSKLRKHFAYFPNVCQQCFFFLTLSHLSLSQTYNDFFHR
jgi:hypothetical protein